MPWPTRCCCRRCSSRAGCRCSRRWRSDVPVVTADRYGTKELAEGAAVLVDPESVDSIADGIRRVLDDAALRDRLIAAGRERSRDFRWERTARETLAALERVAGQARHEQARRSPSTLDTSPVSAPESRCTWNSCWRPWPRPARYRSPRRPGPRWTSSQPNLREVVAARRPEFGSGAAGNRPGDGLEALVRPVALPARGGRRGSDAVPRDGRLPSLLTPPPRPRGGHGPRPRLAGPPRAVSSEAARDVRRALSLGGPPRRPVHHGVPLHRRRPDAPCRCAGLADPRRSPRTRLRRFR